MCGGKKNKKHWVGLSVGLPIVELKYGIYVIQLSKRFVLVLMFKFWSVGRLWNGRPTIGYNYSIPAPFRIYPPNRLYTRNFGSPIFLPVVVH
jgi:hypothetical protein